MIAEFQKNVNKYVGLGILFSLVGGIMGDRPGSSLVLIIGEVLFMYGLYFYAKAKGYSGWFCLFGLLNLLGLIVLVLLPDHRKQG
jgi:hypothetical protein